jgi:hypothetical protein
MSSDYAFSAIIAYRDWYLSLVGSRCSHVPLDLQRKLNYSILCHLDDFLQRPPSVRGPANDRKFMSVLHDTESNELVQFVRQKIYGGILVEHFVCGDVAKFPLIMPGYDILSALHPMFGVHIVTT